ncbi:MAG: dihydropteroate synthase [Solirubrobacterales bacterium]
MGNGNDVGSVRTAAGRLSLERPAIVGVVNATPDSFSDEGDRTEASFVRKVTDHVEAGATVIEVGGESNVTNRPAVDAEEEVARVVPVVEAAVALGATVSIDTYKPEVAERALEAGAAIVNDISGSSREEMLAVCARHGAGMVVMHTEVPPKTQKWDEGLYPEGVVARQVEFFSQRLEGLAEAGIEPDQVVLDPGPDFGKTPLQTIESVRGIPTLIEEFGRPVMLAVSRKDFVGALTDRRPRERAAGTLAAIGFGLDAGARLLRVHDVAGTADYLRVREALRGEVEVSPGLRISDEVRREPPAGSDRS